MGSSGYPRCEDADRALALVLPDRAEYESGPSRPEVEDPPGGEHAPEEYAEYLTKDKTTPIFGRLRTPAALRFWRVVLRASVVVMTWLAEGYRLPWAGGAPPDFRGRWAPNKPGVSGPSAFGPREEFVDSALESLLVTGAVRGCTREYLQLVSPLDVVEQTDKLRLIIDQSFLSDHLVYDSFKFEDLRQVPLIFEQTDYLFSIDLMSAYHHVALHESAWPFMGFCWRGRFYHFRVLPFGLGPAPLVFAKITAPLVEHWRSQGMKILPYLDDFLGGAGSVREHTIAVHRVLSDMRAAGWLVSASKVKLSPARVLTHLGLVLDFSAGVFRVPARRQVAFKALVGAILLAGGEVTARRLAKVAGTAQSFRLAMGAVVNFYTRHIYVLLERRTHWGARLRLDAEALRELRFWAGVDFGSFAREIWRPLHMGQGRITQDADMYSDAGDKGWGGCICLPSGARRDARGYLTLWQRAQSSTWRELYAVWQLLRTFRADIPQGSTLVWYTDSQNLASNMQKGGSVTPLIHRIMLAVFETCLDMRVEVVWRWVPRELNGYTDELSKVFDKDDWSLHPGVFALLDALWGPHTVDRFASDLNHQVDAFNSFHWCPGTLGVDAFAQLDWLHAGNWCNPPFHLIGRLLRFLQQVHAEATLVAPHWPRQPWWPLLCPDGAHLAEFVVDVRAMQAHPQLFASGEHSGNARGCRMPGYMFYALRVSFAHGVRYVGPPRCLSPFGCGCGGGVPTLEGLAGVLAEAV